MDFTQIVKAFRPLRTAFLSTLFVFLFPWDVRHVLEAEVYVVPGHYRTLGQAVQSVGDGDTVVIRPGTPEAPMPRPGVYRVAGKEVVIGVWMPGTRRFREARFGGQGTEDMDLGLWYSLQDTTGTWMPQERITGPDTIVDIMPHPFYDPVRRRYWVVWH